MAVVVENNLELISQDESPAAAAKRLVAALKPCEIKYALLKAGHGRKGVFAHPGEGLRQDIMLDIVDLPPKSEVALKPEVKELIALLRSGELVDITPMITAMQEVGILSAQEVKLKLLLDEKTDPKLQLKVAESFEDRDPQGRTIKRKVQVNRNDSFENEGLKAFKDVCARKRVVSGVATERRVEFHTEPEGEGTLCQTSQE